MNIPRDLIAQAKETLGERAAEIIAQGLGINKWHPRNLKGCCPFHKDDTPSFSWHKKENYFKCFGCDTTYDIIDYYTQSQGLTFLEACKKLFDETGVYFDFESISPKRKKEYKYPMEEKNSKRDKVEDYMKIRGISKETLDYAGIKQDRNGNIVFEYKDQNGQLLLVKYRPARQVKKGENKLWCQKDADTTPVLYGMHQINPTKPLLICEGEIDRLACIESGWKNVVSVPFGASNYTWIEHNYEWLQQFEKIIIWSDNDEAGEKMRNEVIPRLGEYRCYYVKSKYKDINIHLYKEGKTSVLKAISEAKEVPIKNIIDLADVEEFDVYRAEKIRSGYAMLDKYISGFILGTVNVITGYNSSGKSTLVNQMCVAEPLKQGYKTFIFSGELTKQHLRNWIEYPIAGPAYVQEIDNGPNQPKSYYVPKEIKAAMREWYKGKIFIYDNEEDYRASSVLEKMKEMAMRYGVKNFVIDNLMMIDLECSEFEKYSKQKDFILSLKSFSRRFKCVIHLVAHPRKTAGMVRLSKMDVAGSGDITNLADYVISVHRVTKNEKEVGCPFDNILDLFKNRPLGFQDKEVGLYFNMASKRFYGGSDDLNQGYGWEETMIKSEFIQVDFKCPWD